MLRYPGGGERDVGVAEGHYRENYLARLKDSLGYTDYVFAAERFGLREALELGHVGNGIVSRFPIVQKSTVQLPFGVVLLTQLDTPLGMLRVYNLQCTNLRYSLDLKYWRRLFQQMTAFEAVGATSDEHEVSAGHILVGDFAAIRLTDYLKSERPHLENPAIKCVFPLPIVLKRM